MPKRKVTSAPWVPVPARAYTGKAPRARQNRAVGRLSAGAPRLHKSCRWRRPQSKGRSCRSGRARRDLRVRGGRGHLSERPGWPSGSPISRGSTVSMIAFGGRRGPHRSGSRCRGRPIERREAGREGCLWPNAASQGRPPDGSGGESERSTQKSDLSQSIFLPSHSKRPWVDPAERSQPLWRLRPGLTKRFRLPASAGRCRTCGHRCPLVARLPLKPLRRRLQSDLALRRPPPQTPGCPAAALL